MPKIYNDKDRIKLQEKIVSTASKLFRKSGFLKTSIEQITSEVGIAQGTFYNFFKSKEMLFFEIMGQKEVEKFQIIDEIFTDTGEPQKELTLFFKRMFENVIDDPIFHWLYKEKLFDRIVSKISMEEMEKHMKYDIDAASKILKSLHSRGYLRKLGTDEFVSHTRALFMITLHKEELGVYDFKVFMNRHIDLFVNGLSSLYGA